MGFCQPRGRKFTLGANWTQPGAPVWGRADTCQSGQVYSSSRAASLAGPLSDFSLLRRDLGRHVLASRLPPLHGKHQQVQMFGTVGSPAPGSLGTRLLQRTHPMKQPGVSGKGTDSAQGWQSSIPSSHHEEKGQLGPLSLLHLASYIFIYIFIKIQTKGIGWRGMRCRHQASSKDTGRAAPASGAPHQPMFPQSSASNCSGMWKISSRSSDPQRVSHRWGGAGQGMHRGYPRAGSSVGFRPTPESHLHGFNKYTAPQSAVALHVP